MIFYINSKFFEFLRKISPKRFLKIKITTFFSFSKRWFDISSKFQNTKKKHKEFREKLNNIKFQRGEKTKWKIFMSAWKTSIVAFLDIIWKPNIFSLKNDHHICCRTDLIKMIKFERSMPFILNNYHQEYFIRKNFELFVDLSKRQQCCQLQIKPSDMAEI